MNWNTKNLTTVDKERVWKEYVGRESENRVVHDEYRQRVTEKSRDPEVKLSPRGKRFMAKEPYGIRMELNAETGRMTPVLTDRVVKGGSPHRVGGAGATTASPTKALASSSTSSTAANSRPATSENNNGNGVRLPNLQLSTSALLQQQQQQQQQSKAGLSSPTMKSPTAAATTAYQPHIIYGRSSPRKATVQSTLQAQYLQNNFSSSTSPHHGGGSRPEADLDRALKNLQFMQTSNAAIGRGTVEVLQGVPVGGLRSGGASGATSPLASMNNTVASRGEGHSGNTLTPTCQFGASDGDFGASVSGALRATYNAAHQSQLTNRSEHIPGSPRSYVVKDVSGGSLFDYGRKHCDITRTHQELALRK